MLRATLFASKLERCLFVVTFIVVSGVVLTTDAAAQTESEAVRFHETFEDLNDWEPLTFRKIDRHSSYKTAFGEEPPAKATIAVMNDSDNTGESSISWIDDIRVYAENYNE